MYEEDDSIPGPPARLRHLLEAESQDDDDDDDDVGYDSGGF